MRLKIPFGYSERLDLLWSERSVDSKRGSDAILRSRLYSYLLFLPALYQSPMSLPSQ